jgi:membrane fusion protein (multidrug efflux system)
VPQVAIVQNDQGRFVWVAGTDGKAVLKPIEGSSWIGRDWLITKGIAPGDQVIVDNLLKLRPGASVAAKEAGAPGGPPQQSTPTTAPDAKSPPQKGGEIKTAAPEKSG